MADISLPNVVYFIGVIIMFTFLLGLMPSGFIYAGQELGTYDEQSYPAYLRAHEIAQLQYWENETLTYGGGFQYIDLNTTRWKGIFRTVVTNRSVELYYIVWEWWIFEYAEICEWVGYNVSEMTLNPNFCYYEDALNNWYGDQNASKFRGKSPSSPLIDIWLADSNTTRNDLAEAWFTDGELEITLGMGIDTYTSTLTAWGMVAKFLTFQPVGDMPIYITYPMNVFIWVGIGYCIYCLIVKVIPLVGG